MIIKRSEKTRRKNKCPFCETGVNPYFTDVPKLKSFLTERGKIVARSRSGVCLTHQRRLTQAIKHARYMALLPFVSLAR